MKIKTKSPTDQPIGKPDKYAVVDGWDAIIFGSDGETVLKAWRWTGEYWQLINS